MKKFFTSGRCPKCRKQLFTSDIEGYGFYCEDCDENFYSIEVKENLSDLFEISIVMPTDFFKKHLETLREIADKYNCCFLGHDDISGESCGFTDFGWEDDIPNSEIINSFVKDIEFLLNK